MSLGILKTLVYGLAVLILLGILLLFYGLATQLGNDESIPSDITLETAGCTIVNVSPASKGQLLATMQGDDCPIAALFDAATGERLRSFFAEKESQ